MSKKPQFHHRKLYDHIDAPTAAAQDNPFPDQYLNEIIARSSEQMTELPDNSVHLCVTSPPYNVGMDYEEDATLEDYLAMLKSVFTEVSRVLVDGGRLCVNVANIGRQPYIPLTAEIHEIAQSLGLLCRGEIIWKKGDTPNSTAWGSWAQASNPTIRDLHEYILIFSKGGYARRGGQSTLESAQFMAATSSIWEIAPESAKRVGHPAPFPVDIPARLINLYSFKGDVVLDPFMGSGTTALAAIRTARKYIGYEVKPGYVALAEKRLRPEKNQLRFDFPEPARQTSWLNLLEDGLENVAVSGEALARAVRS